MTANGLAIVLNRASASSKAAFIVACAVSCICLVSGWSRTPPKSDNQNGQASISSQVDKTLDQTAALIRSDQYGAVADELEQLAKDSGGWESRQRYRLLLQQASMRYRLGEFRPSAILFAQVANAGLGSISSNAAKMLILADVRAGLHMEAEASFDSWVQKERPSIDQASKFLALVEPDGHLAATSASVDGR